MLLYASVELLWKTLHVTEKIPDIRQMIRDDPMLAIELGLSGPLRVFHKMEPHPSKKKDRIRIIVCKELCSQLVERVLSRDWSKHLISQFPNGASMMGLGFSDDQVGVVGEKFASDFAGHLVVSTDISGQDSRDTVQWMEADQEVRYRCTIDKEHYTKWNDARKLIVSLNTACVYAMPDGILLAKDDSEYCLPSGSYDTSTTQNGVKALSCKLAKSPVFKNNGDDANEAVPPGVSVAEYISRHAAVGMPVKDDYSIIQFPQKTDTAASLSFDFCSHRFVRREDGSWGASLITWPKTLFKLFTSANPTREQIASVVYELRGNEDLIHSFRYVKKFEELYAQTVPLTSVVCK
jgi:hypothetical protein